MFSSKNFMARSLAGPISSQPAGPVGHGTWPPRQLDLLDRATSNAALSMTKKRQQKGHGHNRSSNGSTIEKVNDMEFVKLSTELRGKKSTIPGESMCER